MNVRVNLRHVLGAGAVLFAVAALYMSVLIDRRQDELSKASRYDLSWTAAQTVVEIARLGQAIGAYAASPGLTSDREVQMRYDLLVSRVSMFDSLEFRALAHEDPTSGRVIGTLRRSVPELGPLVDNLDEHANVAEALRVLTGLTSEAAALASAANQRGGTNAYESQRSLLHLHWLFSGLTFSLVGAGVVLLFSLARQNRTLVRTREAAHRAKALAEIGSQAKTDFLASMSHEIRTPLSGIMGFTDLILDRKDLDAELRRQVDLIRTSSLALLTVVNDVLDFSKIEAGAIDLDPKPFSPEALISNCTSIVRGLAAQKGLELIVRAGPGVPRSVLGDEPRMQQILLNLLNNAIKFTPAGSVTLLVESRASRGGERLRFTVTDTGIGIPADKQDRLFQRFSQVDGSASRQYGGTGLGLAICKSLIDRMNGSIGVTSEPGTGSTFWFEIPVTRADENAIRTAELDPVLAPRNGRGHILVAEDVLINQEIIRAVLESAGHHVDVVSDGAQAIMALQNEHYDLVLMDVQMPAVDGIQATQHIRALKGPLASIPVIALTANVYAEQVSGFLKAGMNDHVGKPIDRAKLLATVDRWIGISAETTAPHSAPPEEAEQVLDEHTYGELRQLMGQDAVSALLNRLADQLRAGEADFDAAGRNENRQQLAASAHRMVSSAGMLGFKKFSALCSDLECACLEGGAIEDLVEHVKAARNAVLEEIDLLAQVFHEPERAPLRQASR